MLRVTPIYGSSLSSTSKPDDDDPMEWLSSPVPSCTLVEYAGMKLLLNAGWDETLPAATSVSDVNNNNNNNNNTTNKIIPNELPDVDAILITDSTLSSLGGLPMYFGASKHDRRGRSPRSLTQHNDAKGEGGNQDKKRNPPFLATYPTVKMGQMTLYDHHASLSLDGTHPGYSLDDVDAVFGEESVITLKYSQTLYLPLDDEDGHTDDIGGGGTSTTKQQQQKQKNSKTSNKLLSITPHLSGHVVGGCYYVLKQLADDTEVILAPTYHHAKEKHLAGSTLHKFGVNADALLTMPGGARGLLGKLYQPPPPGAKGGNNGLIHYNKGKPILSPPLGNRSEAEMIESMMAALRRDGNVLLPVDASGRVLELLLILDRYWERQRLGGAYNLVCCLQCCCC
jgi:cleavage and polyadenylation specificity factor subunit 2